MGDHHPKGDPNYPGKKDDWPSPGDTWWIVLIASAMMAGTLLFKFYEALNGR